MPQPVVPHPVVPEPVVPQPLVPGAVTIVEGDNLAVAATLPSGSFTLVYLDPPFNTGRTQERQVVTARRTLATPQESVPATEPVPGIRDLGGVTGTDLRSSSPEPGETAPAADTEVRHGFHGHAYERVRGMLRAYDDRFDDYGSFLMPRLEEAWRLLADDGTLYLHLDYREAHYAKVMLDAVFGRDCFLNELIWAYDYGAKSRSRWPTKHDTILVYVKNPRGYVFNSDEVDREPYMAPGLVTAEKAARGNCRPTCGGTRSCPPPVGRRPAIPRRSPRGSCGASSRRRVVLATVCSTSSRAVGRRERWPRPSDATPCWSTTTPRPSGS